MQRIKERQTTGKALNYMAVVREDEKLTGAARRLFGSWDAALREAGIDPGTVKRPRGPKQPRGAWSKERVIQKIQERFAAGLEMSAHAVQIDDPSLEAAAKALFGSYANAIEAAGLEYCSIRKRGGWTPETVTDRIKVLATAGADLSDRAASRQWGDLYGAAETHFGGWAEAVKAAGLDYRLVRRTRSWSREAVAEEIQRLAGSGVNVRSRRSMGNKAYSQLVAAAIKHFGSWTAALEEAGLADDYWRDKPNPRVRNRIRERRKSLGISQTELGRRVGVSHRTISNLELGNQPDPRVSFAIRLARALNCRVEDIFDVD